MGPSDAARRRSGRLEGLPSHDDSPSGDATSGQASSIVIICTNTYLCANIYMVQTLSLQRVIPYSAASLVYEAHFTPPENPCLK